MSQGKVVVEFKKANGGNIEVSEEKFLQSQQWFERIINTELEPLQSVDGEVDNFNDEDHSYDEDEDEDDKGHETPERGSSSSTFSDVTNRYPGELPQTPAIIIKNIAKFKPYTPPTISDKMRQEMIAKRLSDRKRKAEDELPAPSAPTPPSAPSTITPEQRERARKNREAALALRRTLQNR